MIDFTTIYNDKRYQELSPEKRAIVIKRYFNDVVASDSRYANLSQDKRAIVQKRFLEDMIAPIEKTPINISFDGDMPANNTPTDMTGVNMQTGYSETDKRQSDMAKAEKRITELRNSLMRANPIARKNINKEIVHWQNVIAFTKDGMTPDERAAYEGAKSSWMGKNPIYRGIASVGAGAIDLASSLSTVLMPDSEIARITKATSEGIQADAGTIEKAIDSVLMSMPMTVAVGINPLLGTAAIESAIVKGNLQELSDKYGSLEKAGGAKIANAVIKGTIESGIEIVSDLAQLKLLRSSLKAMPKGKATAKIAKMLSDKMTTKGLAKDIFKGAMTEGLEEVTQNLSNRIYDSISGEEPFPSVADFTKESLTAFAGGFGGGLLFGSYMGGGSRVIDNRAWKQVKTNTDDVSKTLVSVRENIIKGDIETAKTLYAPIHVKAINHKDSNIRTASANVKDALLQKDTITGNSETAKELRETIKSIMPESLYDQMDKAVTDAIKEDAVGKINEVSAPQVQEEVASDYSGIDAQQETFIEANRQKQIEIEKARQKIEDEIRSAENDEEIAAMLNQGIDVITSIKESVEPITYEDAIARQYESTYIPVSESQKMLSKEKAEQETEQGVGGVVQEAEEVVPVAEQESAVPESIAPTTEPVVTEKPKPVDYYTKKTVSDQPTDQPKTNLVTDQPTEWQVPENAQKRADLKQVLLDNIETRRQKGEKIPDGWKDRLAKIIAYDNGIKINDGDIISNVVYGHPESSGDNFIPIKVSRGRNIDSRVIIVQKEIDRLSKKIGTANAIVNKHLKGTAKQVKESKEYLSSMQHTEDEYRRDMLLKETLPELQRIQNLLAKPKPVKKTETTPKATTENQSPQVSEAQGAVAPSAPDIEKRKAEIDKQYDMLDKQWNDANKEMSDIDKIPSHARTKEQKKRWNKLAEIKSKTFAEKSELMVERMKLDPEEGMSGLLAAMKIFQAEEDKITGKTKQEGQDAQENAQRSDKTLSEKGDVTQESQVNSLRNSQQNGDVTQQKPQEASKSVAELKAEIRELKAEIEDAETPKKKAELTKQLHALEKQVRDVKHSLSTTASKGTKSISKLVKGFVSVIKSKVSETAVDPKTNTATVTLKNGDIIRINAVSGAIDVKYNGKTQFVNEGNISAIVDMSMDVGDTDLVAFHEGGHVAFRLFLSDNERKLLLDKFGTEENAIIAFQNHIAGKLKQTIPQRIAQIFSDLWTRLKVGISRMMGREFAKNWVDVFKSMRLGEYARPSTADNQDVQYSKIVESNISREHLEAMKAGKAKAKAQGETINEEVHKVMLNSIDGAKQYRKVSKEIADAISLEHSGQLTEKQKKENFDKIQQGIRHYADIALRSGIPESLKIGKTTFTRAQVKQIINATIRIRSMRSLQRNLIQIAKIADKANHKQIKDAFLRKLNKALAQKKVDADTYILLKHIKAITQMPQSEIDRELQSMQNHISDEESKDILTRMSSDVRTEYISMFSNLDVKSPERLAAAYANLLQVISTGKSVYEAVLHDYNDNARRMLNIMFLIAPKKARAFTKNELNMGLTGIDAKSKRGGKDKPLSLFSYNALLNFDSLMRDLDRALYVNRKYIREHYNRLVARLDTESADKIDELKKDIAMLEQVLPSIENWDGTNGFFYNEIFLKQIQPAYRTKAKLMSEKHSMVYGKLTELYRKHFGKDYGKQFTSAIIASVTSESIDKLNKRLKDTDLPVVSPHHYTIKLKPIGKDGETTDASVVMNLQQIANFYAYSKNPKLTETLVHMGFDSDAIAQIHEILKTDKYGMVMKDYVDWAMDVFYPQFYHEINDVYREVTGYDLAREEIYSPLARFVKKAERQADMNAPVIYGLNAETSSTHHIERTDNIEPISFNGQFLNDMLSHINTETHYISLSKQIRDIKQTLLNKDVLNTIEMVLGKGKRKAVLSFLNDMAAGAYGQLVKESAFSKWANNVTFAALAVNLKLIMAQMSSMPLFFMEFYKHPHMILPSMLYTLTHLDETYKAMKSSPILHQRYTEGITFDYIMSISGKLGLAKTYKQFHNQWLAPGVWGDKMSVLVGGGAYYWYKYHQYNKTMSSEQASEKAIADMELMTERTQQGQSPYFVNHLQRATTIGHYAMRFQTQPNALFNIVRDAILDASVNKKRLPDALWKLSLVLISQMMFLSIASGFAKRNDIYDIVYDILMGLSNIIPIWGNAIQYGITAAATGDANSVYEGNFMVGASVPNDIAKSAAYVKKAIDAYSEDNSEGGNKNIMQAAKMLSPATGLPIRGVINDITGMTDYMTGTDPRVGRLFGMSQSWLDRQEKLYRDKIGKKLEFDDDSLAGYE